MKNCTALLLACLTIIGCLFSCKEDENAGMQELVEEAPKQEAEIVTYYITTVNNLRAREGQLKSSEVIAKLKEGTIIKSLNQESDLKETITLRGKSFTEPYRKVLIDGGKEAWVYGGGVEIFHSGEDIDDITSINNFKSFLKGMAGMKISNGNAVLKKLMQLSSENPSTNDALYFLAKDYMDKLSFQGTLDLDKEGITMEEDYASIADRIYDMNSSRIGKEADESGFLLTASEGMIGYQTDQYALEGAIGGIFSPEVKEYIRLKKNEYKHRLFSDAAISGSLEDLMNDAIAWSNFVDRYPNFPKSRESNNTQEYLKRALFFGTENTPAYDYETNVAKKEFRDIWNMTLETYPNAPFAQELYTHIQNLEENDWKFSN